MTTARLDVYRRIDKTEPAFHRHLYEALRELGHPACDAYQASVIQCAECDGYADHWHTVTGTTLDDAERDLDELLEGCTLVGPMACGPTADISLMTGDWWPHCELCDNAGKCEDCGKDCEDDDRDWICDECHCCRGCCECEEDED